MKWLFQEIVCPGVERRPPACTNNNDGNIFTFFSGPELTAHLEAIDIRHPLVEYNKIGTFILRLKDEFSSGRFYYFISGVFQHDPHSE